MALAGESFEVNGGLRGGSAKRTTLITSLSKRPGLSKTKLDFAFFDMEGTVVLRNPNCSRTERSAEASVAPLTHAPRGIRLGALAT